MAKFNFQAKSTNGKAFNGEIEAANEAEARVKLRAQRLVPLRLVAKAEPKAKVKVVSAPGVNFKDLQIFTRQLATLLSSGVPILQSLETLGEGSRSPGLTIAIKSIAEEVSKGKRFGDALAMHPKVFDKFYCNMVTAGEESGNLDTILNRLAVYIEKAVKIKAKIKGAMVYPVAILVVAFGVVAGLLVFVIPKFKDLFSQQGQELPAITQIVVKMSESFQAQWYLILGVIGGGVFALIQYYKSEAGRQVCDGILIDVPFIGDLQKKGAVAKFTRTLSTLLNSGVGIMESLDIASRVVGNHVIEKAILRARDAISEGKSLTVPLSKEKYMPHMVTQMIGVGEQTGALDVMLGKVADFYEDEVDVAVSALTSVLEPMMMVVLGGIVAFFVVAMYLPIFNMASAVG